MKSEPIDCASVLEHLLERDDESPASAERAAACAAHLDTCTSCRAQAERLGHALAALRERSGDPVPAIDVWAGVRATLASEGRLVQPEARHAPAAAPAVTIRARRRATVLRRTSAFAAAAAALALFWHFGTSSAPSAPADSAVARTEAPSAAPQPALVASPAGETLAPARTLPLAGAPELQTIPTSAGTSGGLRRATGEERRRDFSVPFESATGSSGWSLASDRELR